MVTTRASSSKQQQQQQQQQQEQHRLATGQASLLALPPEILQQILDMVLPYNQNFYSYALPSVLRDLQLVHASLRASVRYVFFENNTIRLARPDWTMRVARRSDCIPEVRSVQVELVSTPCRAQQGPLAPVDERKVIEAQGNWERLLTRLAKRARELRFLRIDVTCDVSATDFTPLPFIPRHPSTGYHHWQCGMMGEILWCGEVADNHILRCLTALRDHGNVEVVMLTGGYMAPRLLVDLAYAVECEVRAYYDGLDWRTAYERRAAASLAPLYGWQGSREGLSVLRVAKWNEHGVAISTSTASEGHVRDGRPQWLRYELDRDWK